VKTGQILYFGKTGETATVLANGAIKHHGKTGSIHSIGREIQNAPCNGWDHWYYIDENTGQKVTIDTLREKYLADAQRVENEIKEK
jgi:modification methylase